MSLRHSPSDISLFSEIFETDISDINNSIVITSIIIFVYIIIVNIKETYFIWKKRVSITFK
jgi:hypothetical protein